MRRAAATAKTFSQEVTFSSAPSTDKQTGRFATSSSAGATSVIVLSRSER